MNKSELIQTISHFVLQNLCRNRKAIGYGWCYRLCGSINRNGIDYMLHAASFCDLIPEHRGELFFTFTSLDRLKDDIHPYASELTEDELQSIINLSHIA